MTRMPAGEAKHRLVRVNRLTQLVARVKERERQLALYNGAAARAVGKHFTT